MTKPIISVIMPVYNAEKYIRQSIESVINQTFSNWELIIINDNSKDNSNEICKQYENMDNRIHVFQNLTELHGPGAARNMGLEQINGKYTCFLDADDWMDAELFEKVLVCFQNKNIEYVHYGHIVEKGKSAEMCVSKFNGSINMDELKTNAYQLLRENWGIWSGMICSRIVQKIRFNQLAVGEDICFQLQLMNQLKLGYVLNQGLYHYRISPNSTCHRWQESVVECQISIWNHEKIFLKKHGLSDEDNTMKKAAIDRYIGGIYQLSLPACPLTYGEKKKLIKNAFHKMDIKKGLKHYSCDNDNLLDKIRHMFVKYRLSSVLLLTGPFFLKYVRKER